MRNRKYVRVFAPATVANVSCGFDVLGFAVDAPGDEVVLALTDSGKVEMEGIEGDGGLLPMEADRNTCGVAVTAFLAALGKSQGVSIRLKKNLALGSGMGSSAASSVAAVLGINHLMGEPFTRKELLPFAMEAERVACGAAHADNVAPSLLGGFVLIRGYDPLDVIDIPTPPDLYCTLLHPHLQLNTKDSRGVLRNHLPLKDAITQWGNIAGLIAGLMKSDYDLIGRSLNDVVAEPVRSLLIPGFAEIKRSALDNGALGAGISGSGPTIFALAKSKAVADKVGLAVHDAFRVGGLSSDVFVSKINANGATILE